MTIKETIARHVERNHMAAGETITSIAAAEGISTVSSAGPSAPLFLPRRQSATSQTA